MSPVRFQKTVKNLANVEAITELQTSTDNRKLSGDLTG